MTTRVIATLAFLAATACDSSNGSSSNACGDGPPCESGYRCAYDPGCATPSMSCHPNTCGDGCAWIFCACDGATSRVEGGCCEPDDRPYAHRRACDAAGGD